MRFTTSFPGMANQAAYPRDMIGLMGHMKSGGGVSAEQLNRFGVKGDAKPGRAAA